jgi:3'-5' exoribonuclease
VDPDAAISGLEEDRLVDGAYAVARKERARTRAGRTYLVLELMDATGRIDGRVWNDVELLAPRFEVGDAVRVLGRVERFRDRLQLDIRSIEQTPGIDPAGLLPRARRELGELDGFLEFLAAELSHPGLSSVASRFLADEGIRVAYRGLPATPDGHHGYAGGLLEHTVAVATISRDLCQLHLRLRGDLLVTAALLHDIGRTAELKRAPGFPPTREGELLGHLQLGVRIVESMSGADLDTDTRAELLHAIASHHDARGAQTAEAAALYHANQLDAVAATRPTAPTSPKGAAAAPMAPASP